jgi:hypothetical protein
MRRLNDYKIGDEVIVYNMRLEKIKVVITEISDSVMYPGRKRYRTLSNRARYNYFYAYEIEKVES